ncbi:ATP-binding protein [Actinomadura sp. WMMB 499]|uniref:ATP-binding protein n=1 Tax=Actinomadura sp. WMMB 499 TaxID=1219491 RepID=UPI001247B219|nr:ATP-binding protein [Actinomadura sp. WMMB 499]QFG24180.1 sensor histidine kinase [Actinomadura sp. WMMB 499]
MTFDADRSRIERAALERALRFWLVAVIVGGAAWLAAVLAAAPADRALVAAGGGGLILALCVAAALAVYFAALARRLDAHLAVAEEEDERLARRLRELVDGPLPLLVGGLRDCAAPESVLADLPETPDPVLARLLRVVVEGVAAVRADADRAREETAALRADAAWLTGTVLPELRTRMPERIDFVHEILDDLDRPATETFRRLAHETGLAIAHQRRWQWGVTANCALTAARMQAAVRRVLRRLYEMEFRYDETDVFWEIMDLDHQVSQLGRLADSVATMCDGRSGRRWQKPIPMERIVRSAMGRCDDFRRVRYITDHDRAVCGPHAEGVIQALAELIDNALMFSLDDTPVHVYVEKEISGVVITVEDAGMGMRHTELAHAEYLVARPDDRTAWTGEAVGLAVVGMLAAKHGLKVSFRPSSRGGVAAVLFVPAAIVTRPVERWPWSDDGAPGTEDEEVPSDRRTAGLAGMPPIPDGRTVLAREREKERARERERERARERVRVRSGGAAAVPAPAPREPFGGPSCPTENEPGEPAEPEEVVVWEGMELPKRRRGATIGPAEWALMGMRPPEPEKEDEGEAFAAFMGPPGGGEADDTDQPGKPGEPDGGER